MFKKVDLLLQAGNCWHMVQTGRKNALDDIVVDAKMIIDLLDEHAPDGYNAVRVFQLMTFCICIADDVGIQANVTPNTDFLHVFNELLTLYDFEEIDGNVLEIIEPLEYDVVEDLAITLNHIREHIEPQYGDVAINLILLTALIQQNEICQAVFNLAALFLDEEFDIIPTYDDFLLEF